MNKLSAQTSLDKARAKANDIIAARRAKQAAQVNDMVAHIDPASKHDMVSLMKSLGVKTVMWDLNITG